MGLRAEAAAFPHAAQQYLRPLGNRNRAGSDLDGSRARSLAHQGVRTCGARGRDRVHVCQAAALPRDGPAGRRLHSVPLGAGLLLYLEGMRMGMVRPDIGSQMVDLCAALLLVTCFAIVAQRRLSACVDVFALQSAFLAATAALVAFLTGIHHIYVAAALTVVIKVIVIPRILKKVIERLNRSEEHTSELQSLTNLVCRLLLE